LFEIWVDHASLWFVLRLRNQKGFWTMKQVSHISEKSQIYCWPSIDRFLKPSSNWRNRTFIGNYSSTCHFYFLRWNRCWHSAVVCTSRTPRFLVSGHGWCWKKNNNRSTTSILIYALISVLAFISLYLQLIPRLSITKHIFIECIKKQEKKPVYRFLTKSKTWDLYRKIYAIWAQHSLLADVFKSRVKVNQRLFFVICCWDQ